MDHQLSSLKRLLRIHVNWLTAILLGKELLSKEDLAELKKYGKLPLDKEVSFIEKAFSLGQLSAIHKKADYGDVSLDKLSRFQKKKFSSVEKLAIREAKLHADRHMQAIVASVVDEASARVNQAAGDLVGQVSRRLSDEVALALAEKKTSRELATSLSSIFSTGLKKDWQKFATTELHRAKIRGVAMAISNKVDIYKKSDGIDSEVSVVPNRDACPDCLALYLDESGNPKILSLKELVDRGTNASGVKHTRNKEGLHKHWKAVMPPAHPNCYCSLVYVPPGMSWKSGKLVVSDKLRHKEHLSKAVDTGSMKPTVKPPGPKSTQGPPTPKPASIPGLAAPGNTPGPGAPASQATTATAPSQPQQQEQPDGSIKELVPCPFGGGVECVKHDGSGAPHHEPDGSSMQGHRKYKDSKQGPEDVVDPLKIAAAAEWGKETHPLPILMDHLANGDIVHTVDLKDKPDEASQGFITDVRKVTIDNNGNGALKSVLYDRRENIPFGSSHHREVAGYKTFNAFGMDYCPPTTSRTSDGKAGSIQHWLEEYNSAGAHIATSKGAETRTATEMIKLSPKPKETRQQLEDITIMDMLMNNTDRHLNNLMVSDDFSSIKAIDHGNAFGLGLNGYRSSVHQDFNSINMKIKLKEGLKQRFENTSLGDLDRALGDKLLDWEVAQTFLRMRYIQHVQERYGHLPYSEFKFSISNKPRTITRTSDENRVVDEFKNRQMPDQKFEDFCVDYIDSVSADESHPDYASANHLNELGVFMKPDHETTKSTYQYRKNGEHIQYEVEVRSHKKSLADKKKSAKKVVSEDAYIGDEARTISAAENPAAAIQRRRRARTETQ